MLKNCIIISTIFFFISCGNNFDSELLKGNWKTVEWTVKENNQKINAKMDFQFLEEKRYILDYGSELEKGKYWIANSYIHTVEDGKAEKKVKITTLTVDSLVFEMNRAGSIENVVLVRE